MIKYIAFIFILIFINFQTVFSQSKAENFYDTSFQSISKNEFENLSKRKNYRVNQFDLEDQIANILYQPKTKGKLSRAEFDRVKNQINKIDQLKDGYIIIIYYPGKDRCNGMQRNSTWNIFDTDYQRKVNKLILNNQYWIYKKGDNLKYYYPKKINWRKDEEQVIEHLFFKMHYPCFSSVVIDNDGNFISNLGEFGKQDIIEDIKTLKDLK